MTKGPQIEFREDHIHVQLPEDYEFGPSGRDEFWGRLRSMCEEHKTTRVLVEGRPPPGERDTADVVDAGLHAAAVPHLWLAFHFDDFEPTYQSEVFEAIAGSKGVRVKHFSDSERALKWLRNNSPS